LFKLKQDKPERVECLLDHDRSFGKPLLGSEIGLASKFHFELLIGWEQAILYQNATRPLTGTRRMSPQDLCRV